MKIFFKGIAVGAVALKAVLQGNGQNGFVCMDQILQRLPNPVMVQKIRIFNMEMLLEKGAEILGVQPQFPADGL